MTREASTDPAHEARCRRCGTSCHAALPINGLPVVVPGLHCKHLASDGARFRCTVYERRLEVAPWCHTSDEALTAGLLAQDCPYTTGVPGYRGKVWLHARLLRSVMPAVRRELAEKGAPAWVAVEGCLRVLEGGGGRWEASVDEAAGRLWFRRVDAPSGGEPPTGGAGG